jgi:hypothetical protein
MPFGTSGVFRGWKMHRSAGRRDRLLPALLALHRITGISCNVNPRVGTVLIHWVRCCRRVAVYDGIFRHSGRDAVSGAGDVAPWLAPRRVHSWSLAAASLISFGVGVGRV